MRGGFGLGRGLLATMLSVGTSAVSMAQTMLDDVLPQTNRIFGDQNIRRYIQRYGRSRDHHAVGRTSIALRNRHGGPHLDLREKARRLHRPGPERRAWLEQARQAA